MVGYVDDPTVSTKFRVRFESARHNNVPDRAEFFYAKCGCYRDLPFFDPAHDPEAGGPGPGIATDIAFQQLLLAGEYAITDRVSIFAQIPHRWIQPDFITPDGFESGAGIGDVRLGGKLALIDDEVKTFTAQLQVYLPTGDASKGLGTDHNSIEPSLLYYQRLAPAMPVELQLGLWYPFGRAPGVPTEDGGTFAGSVLFYGIGPSYEAYSTTSLTLGPVVELVGWYILDGFQTAADLPPDAGGTNILNLKVGGRASFGQNSVYVGYGFALTDESWYEDIVRIEYRYNFW